MCSAETESVESVESVQTEGWWWYMAWLHGGESQLWKGGQ